VIFEFKPSISDQNASAADFNSSIWNSRLSFSELMLLYFSCHAAISSEEVLAEFRLDVNSVISDLRIPISFVNAALFAVKVVIS
jgi:hypothetical protein